LTVTAGARCTTSAASLPVVFAMVSRLIVSSTTNASLRAFSWLASAACLRFAVTSTTSTPAAPAGSSAASAFAAAPTVTLMSFRRTAWNVGAKIRSS
jgi:hypothetical protein